jgi:hypothetical protein
MTCTVPTTVADSPDSDIIVGRACTDSEPMGGWLLFDAERWQGELPEQAAQGLRNNTTVEMKWGIHSKGDRRPNGWARQSEKTAISFLIRGEFVLRLREPGQNAPLQEVRLGELGDYVIWNESRHEHDWHAITEALILTVRWR